MSFDSVAYLLLLVCIGLALWASGGRWRWQLLLLASVVFYAGAAPLHLLVVLAFVVAVAYVAGKGLAFGRGRPWAPTLFWAAAVVELLVLASLKYVPAMVGRDHPFSLIGVSYYVFQAVAYLSDVHLEKVEAERHPGYLALYLCFFPKLLQGPIERASDLLPQLRTAHRFDRENVRRGLFLFGWGLFKKLVIANRLGAYVDGVYGQVHAVSGLPLALATYGYAFQLYCDFSGYTDMALGSASLLNIRLTQNFRSPYLATSVADFWRRWHISFSKWLLDYVFTPLQLELRRWETWGTPVALLVTFVLCGAWHGGTWGFVVWGSIHGLFLASGVLYQRWRRRKSSHVAGSKGSRIGNAWRRLVTFHLVCFAWIFFRSPGIGDALYVVGSLFQPTRAPSQVGSETVTLVGVAAYWGAVHTVLIPSCLLVAVIVAVDYWQENRDLAETVLGWPAWARWPLYSALCYGTLLFGVQQGEYLYFRF